MHKQLKLLTFNLFLTTTLVLCDFQQPPLPDSFGSKDEKLKAEKQQQYPPCKSCTVFVEQFKKVNKASLVPLSYHHMNLCATWNILGHGAYATWKV
jgi:hypothetical protein